MVTSSGARAVGVTAAALAGLALGFWVQDVLKQRTLARIEARVAAALAALPPDEAAPPSQPPAGASGRAPGGGAGGGGGGGAAPR